MTLRLLFLGDVVGRPGRKALAEAMPRLKREFAPGLVIVNGENAAGGFGLSVKTARELFNCGVDVITTGNHIWKIKDVYPYLDTEPRVLRPANYPHDAPGKGVGLYTVRTARGEVAVAVLNLIGRTFMEPVDCPFRKADALLAELDAMDTPPKVRFVDFHAEATSEKIALAYHLDGRVSAVIGTHTHVQTNDARLQPGGAAALTDAGMCGVRDSALGMDAHAVTRRLMSAMPVRFRLAQGDGAVSGVWVDVDPAEGRATALGLVDHRC